LTIFDGGIEFWFKTAFLKEAGLSRGDLTDEQWRILNPLLPDRGERGPRIPDSGPSMVFSAFCAPARATCPNGNWNSVFVRFSRWSKLGVWDAAFETLASLGPPVDNEHAIDSTIIRAHQHAADVKGGIKIGKRSAARAAASRPKSTSARTPKTTR